MKQISNLLSTDKSNPVQLKIANLGWNDVKKWDKSVQKKIKSCYKKADVENPNLLDNRVRADVDWSWRKNYAISKVFSFMDSLNEPPERRLPFLARGTLVCISNGRGGFVPFAQLIVAPRFRCDLKNSSVTSGEKLRSFLWFLSSAPQEYLEDEEVDPMPIKVLRPLIYHACSLTSQDDESDENSSEYQRGILLRSDPAGGIKLMNMYKTVGFVACEQQSHKISTFRRGADGGEYLVLNADAQENLIRQIEEAGFVN